MNLGAYNAKGDILLFMHADTLLPKAWDRQIKSAISKGFVGGGFIKKYDSRSILLSLHNVYSNTRTILFKDLLGDNCIFVKKEIFNKIHGFKDMEIMEDLEFSKKLKKFKIKIVKHKVTTSARRFEKYGHLRSIALMFWIRTLYFYGKDIKKIKKLYSDTK